MLPVEKENCVLYRDELGQVIQKAKQVVRSSYKLTRRRATELMVWVLTNKDRNTKTEIPCSLPVAYGLKDYHSQRNSTLFVTKAFNLSFMCFKFRVLLGSEISGKS
jgi:hypothetical protein